SAGFQLARTLICSAGAQRRGDKKSYGVEGNSSVRRSGVFDRNGKGCETSGWRGDRSLRRYNGVSRGSRNKSPGGNRLLSPHSGIQRIRLCGGTYTRQLLQTRGTPIRKGNAHLASDRSTHQAAVHQRI